MSALSIQVPFPVFQGRDGQPLENGYVWIGVANLNPQTNPVVVYFDKDLTIPAAQPLRTINGYVSRAGTPAQVYVDGVNFSILVQDSKGTMVYNFPDGTGISPNASGVVYDPAGAGAVATNVQDKLRETVSVKDFGAVGDGVTNDTAAIRNAAAAANTAGVPLRVSRGVYLINSPADIELRVSLDAGGAVFKLGSGMGSTSVFIARGNALEDITANVTLAQIAKDRTTVASLAAYRNGFIRVHSNVPNMTRTPGSEMLFKGECGYVTKGGVLVTPIRHDYTTGGTGITQVQYRRDETEQLIVSGGAVDVNNKVGARFLTVERNDVKVKNWTVLDSTGSARIQTALLFRIFNCANFVMEDISGDAMNQAVSAAFSYLVEINYAFNCQFSRCFVHGGWGAFTSNGVNGYHIRDSNFDRFDIHYDGYDMTVDNCVFYQAVQYGSGGGNLRVTNSTKIAKQLTPFLSNTSLVAQVR
jgi:hypothetical protein